MTTTKVPLVGCLTFFEFEFGSGQEIGRQDRGACGHRKWIGDRRTGQRGVVWTPEVDRRSGYRTEGRVDTGGAQGLHRSACCMCTVVGFH